tara:strand:+ start:5740 stop:6987 length:1248 start_codon:yes stop_codon:yes gene_type:complete
VKIWIIKVGEPLPWLVGEDSNRLWRAGQLAECMRGRGHVVTFWASKFDHYQKRFRLDFEKTQANGIETVLLSSRGYKTNLSFERMMDHRDLAKSFKENTIGRNTPDLIVVAWPTIELAYTAIHFGISHDVPVVLDIRDCWPDIIYDKAPGLLEWIPRYLFLYEHMTKFSFKNATALTAVSKGILEWAQLRGAREASASRLDYFFYQTQYDFLDAEDCTEFWHSKGVDLYSREMIRIVWAGSLEPTLDLETCLRAIEVFSTQSESEIEFIFCGSGSMEQRVGELGWRLKNVVFVGQIGSLQLKSLLANSQIGFMCYPDRYDFNASIPNKVVDFCMAGMRLITNLNGELNTIVPRTEILRYRGGDVSSMVSVLKKIVSNKEIYKTPSPQTRLLFEKKFDASQVLPVVGEYLEQFGKQ